MSNTINLGKLSRHGLHIYSTESQLPVASVIRHRSKFVSTQQAETNTRLAIREERLIALFVAAPDLLEELKWAGAQLAALREVIPNESRASFFSGIQKIASTIDRAEGRT